MIILIMEGGFYRTKLETLLITQKKVSSEEKHENFSTIDNNKQKLF